MAAILLLAGCGGLGGGSHPSSTVNVANPSVSFGVVAVGSKVTLANTIANNTSSSVTITSISGLASGFQLTGITLPLALSAGTSVPFNVQFQPANPGTPSVTISFQDSNAQTIVSLSASGQAVEAGTLSLNPSQIAFGDAAVGSSQTSTVTLSNSGGSDLTVNQATLSGAGFTLSNLTLPLTLHTGDSTSASVTFAPPSSGTFTGSITFTTTSEQVNSTTVLDLSGTGIPAMQGILIPNPASLVFGTVQVGSKTSLSETLTNTGGAPVTISQATISASGFAISGLSLPSTIAVNQSITFTVIFTPTAVGVSSGPLTITSNASNSPLTIALSGTGTSTGSLAVAPTSLAFGNVVVGSSASLSGSLTASGASVTVTAASLNNAEFVVSEISLPVTIAAGQSASFTVTFAPQSTGAASASLSFTSDASNSPAVQSLTGTGTAQTQHTVDLIWDASQDAVGYNIYRGGVSGGPYTMINTSLNSPTAYTDSTVVSGQTYYYVTTAVDSSEHESGYSNQAKAVIPNP
jgi:hypothetical protein